MPNNKPSPFKGQKRSPEICKKISEGLKGKPRRLTDEQRQARADTARRLLGGPRSEEHKRKISEALRGRKKSAEHVQKIVESKTGVVPNFSEEQISAFKQRMSALHKGVPKTEESKRKSSESQMNRSPLLAKYGIDIDEYERQRSQGNRWCSIGRHWGPAGDFNSGEKRGFCDAHKTQHHRASLLRNGYGVAAEWYDEKLAEQGGGCAICGVHKIGKGHGFMPIDHDHATGAVRAILCGRCNALVGSAESPMFPKVLEYLAKHSSAPAQQSVS